MEYVFTCLPDTIDPDMDLMLRFEIYGIRHTAENGEQRNAERRRRSHNRGARP